MPKRILNKIQKELDKECNLLEGRLSGFRKTYEIVRENDDDPVDEKMKRLKDIANASSVLRQRCFSIENVLSAVENEIDLSRLRAIPRDQGELLTDICNLIRQLEAGNGAE